MIESSRASSSSNEVSIRQASSGGLERSSRQVVTPSPSGSRTSSTATSGRRGGHARQGLLDGGRLAGHRDVRLVVQQVAHPAPDHLVVVEEEHPDRVVGSACSRSAIGRSL